MRENHYDHVVGTVMMPLCIVIVYIMHREHVLDYVSKGKQCDHVLDQCGKEIFYFEGAVEILM